MERLTIDTKILFCDISQCRETPGGSFCEDGYCDQRRVYERLREYERFSEKWKLDIEQMDAVFYRVNALGGTDLMAQYRDLGPIADLTALVKARDEGRVAVLPCKVGDTVYALNHHGRVVDGIVKSINQSHIAGATWRWVVTVYYPEYNGTAESGISADFLAKQVYYGFLDFGKTVFLTQSEAEAALKGAVEHETD